MDIVLIIILLLGILIGYKRGLINVVFSIIGIFLANKDFNESFHI